MAGKSLPKAGLAGEQHITGLQRNAAGSCAAAVSHSTRNALGWLMPSEPSGLQWAHEFGGRVEQRTRQSAHSSV